MLPSTLSGARAAADVPLACRLPNPPVLFVGRASEVRFLREAIPAAPVTVVAGEGGLGKSALTLAVLHSQFPERVARAVFVSLRGADPLEPLALAVARTLVRSDGPARFDWSDLLAAPEALATLAIDLADAHGRWVVLDDLHHGDPEQVRALLAQISRYARSSRWIATTREVPRGDDLDGRVLALGAMREADLHRLARALSPSSAPDELRRAVHEAAGSPWRLRQGHAAPHPAGAPGPKDLARGLSAETLAFLQALALVAVPLPEGTLARIAPPPSETLDALEQQALIERTAEGVRLHELTRALVPAADRSPRWQALRAKAGAVLGASSEAALRLEGVRLWLEAGAGERGERAAGAILDAGGDELLGAGYAATLWKLLETPASAEGALRAELALERWRLRCAVQLGDAHVLSRVRAPAGDAAELRFLWAKLLSIKGELVEARAIAEEAQARAERSGDAATACDAGILHARCLANLGHPPRALEVVSALLPPDERRRAQAEGLRAVLLVAVGQPGGALACALALASALPGLPWPARGEVAHRVATALYQMGHLREAADVFDRAVVAERRGSVRFDVGRMLRHLRAGIAVDAGDLERARRELDALDPYLAHASLLRDHVVVARALAALVAGQLDEVDHLCSELGARALPPQIGQEVAAIRLRTRTLRRAVRSAREVGGAGHAGAVGGAERAGEVGGAERAGEVGGAERAGEVGGAGDAEPAEHAGAVGAAPDAEHAGADSVRIARTQLELRSGAITPARALAALATAPRQPELRIAARIVATEARLLSGDVEGALAAGSAAIADAAEHGYGPREAEARLIVCDALVVAGREGLLRAALDELDRVVQPFGSPRFERAVALHRALVEPGGPDPAVLEGLSRGAVALDGEVRARALLGGRAGDALDRCVLAAVVARVGWRVPAPVGRVAPGEPRWVPGWGIDEGRTRVWLPDGRTVDLSRHPMLWSVLRCLAARGGAATKEEVVVAVWGEREYHPLRHDNRLQAAARKLRLQIEDDPAAPTRLLTTTDGYALGGLARWARGANDPAGH